MNEEIAIFESKNAVTVSWIIYLLFAVFLIYAIYDSSILMAIILIFAGVIGFVMLEEIAYRCYVSNDKLIFDYAILPSTTYPLNEIKSIIIYRSRYSRERSYFAIEDKNSKIKCQFISFRESEVLEGIHYFNSIGIYSELKT
ncbi:MAG: hypothetical protein LKG19_06390 [Saprospiraceae bacterium]|jgi:hypothetical protein|nr:hypothetical protein [Saprospiraceae bacterium]